MVSILVGLMSGKAEVKYRSGIIDPEKIASLIEDLGFGASVQESNNKTGEIELSVRKHIYLTSFMHHLLHR